MAEVAMIVRADWLGLSHGVNQAIEEAFEAGLLTDACLAVPCPWVAEAVALLHAHPEWEVGLQLVLHCPTTGCRWGPVAGDAVPTLTDAVGCFPPLLLDSADPDDVHRECLAQVERAKAWGITPAYLEADGLDPTLARQLSEQLGIPTGMTTWGLRPLQLPPGPTPPWWERLEAALSSLTPGTYLWRTTPAQDSPETWGLWPEALAEQAAAEWRALCSAELAALLRARGIELISFRQHLETRLGGAAEFE